MALDALLLVLPPPSNLPNLPILPAEMCWYISYEYTCIHAYHNRFIGLCPGGHCTPCGAIQLISHPVGYPIPLCPVCISAPAHPWTIIWGRVNGIWTNFSPGKCSFMRGVLELDTVSKG